MANLCRLSFVVGFEFGKSKSNHAGRERPKLNEMKIAKLIQNAALLSAVLNLMAGVNPAPAQVSNQTPPAATRPPRPTPPTRDPLTPGYVAAKELPDGAVPPAA